MFNWLVPFGLYTDYVFVHRGTSHLTILPLGLFL